MQFLLNAAQLQRHSGTTALLDARALHSFAVKSKPLVSRAYPGSNSITDNLDMMGASYLQRSCSNVSRQPLLGQRPSAIWWLLRLGVTTHCNLFCAALPGT
jgi:hypothetical protein